MIGQIGDNFEFVMANYFEDFKMFMKARFIKPISLVESHAKDICFMVDIGFMLKALPYKVNIDETLVEITKLYYYLKKWTRVLKLLEPLRKLTQEIHQACKQQRLIEKRKR